MDKLAVAKNKRLSLGFGMFLTDGLAFHSAAEGNASALVSLYRHGFDGSGYVLSIQELSLASAFLAVALNIKEIDAEVASSQALSLLMDKDCSCHYEKMVESLPEEEGLTPNQYPGQAILIVENKYPDK